jgi:outer membrane biogenesis lipoprotein LolB
MMFMACFFAVATLTKMLARIVSPWLPKRQSNVAQLKKWSFYGTICASCAAQTGLFSLPWTKTLESSCLNLIRISQTNLNALTG